MVYLLLVILQIESYLFLRLLNTGLNGLVMVVQYTDWFIHGYSTDTEWFFHGSYTIFLQLFTLVFIRCNKP